ncbi:MAG: mycofactocin system FadH/OYE family oxidoreductase 1 [Solirubrobacteraceae bacterium]
MRLESLGSPLPLGSRRARNRVLFGPHETNLDRGRSISERHVAYYRRRADGGAGVVVVEEASVDPSDWPYERCPLALECEEGWAAVANALHEAGALALAALGHAGGQGTSANSQLPLWAPSPVPEVPGREVPKAMEEEDIATVVRGFAGATRLAVSSGLDGVEVNAGQQSLLRTFLSGLTNRREDGYGQDRLRLAREVLSVVREAAGDRIVGLRLCCDELFPYGGIEPEQGAAIAAELASLVDYLVVVRGSIFSVAATHPDGHAEPGFNRELSARVRAAVAGRAHVVLQGSVVDLEMAAAAIADGVCDAVEMTRAQIADPDLVAKALGGEADRVRPCTLCNQSCRVRDPRNPTVSCIGEPAAGHETEDPPLAGQAERPRKVLVVGGGPAGLECARVAAARGHDVRVLERTDRLGGALRAAAAGPGRERLGLLAGWLETECRRLGVALELGHEATPADVERADAVVLATGSRPVELPFPVDDGARVVTALTILGGNGHADGEDGLSDGTVAVWDPIGGPIGVAVAELLARERPVVLITQDLIVGQQLSRSGDLAPANTRLHQAGVQLAKRARVRKLAARAVELEDVLSDRAWTVEAAALVDCGHRLPEDRLWHATGERFPRAGDAVAPRTAYEAVLEGRRAALALEGAS